MLMLVCHMDSCPGHIYQLSPPELSRARTTQQIYALGSPSRGERLPGVLQPFGVTLLPIN